MYYAVESIRVIWIKNFELPLFSVFTVVPFDYCVCSFRPFNYSGRVTIVTSTPNKTCRRCNNNKRPTGNAQQLNGTMVETGNKGNSKFWSNWNLPIGAWYMIFKNIDIRVILNWLVKSWQIVSQTTMPE